ncbi:hypothetical protein NL676_027582 [Syzygium grande]|nr:hypothetical protein NL676_027582 [Syzygium grande]
MVLPSAAPALSYFRCLIFIDIMNSSLSVYTSIIDDSSSFKRCIDIVAVLSLPTCSHGHQVSKLSSMAMADNKHNWFRDTLVKACVYTKN